LPDHRLIYVSVPKCASSRIKLTLSALLGRSPRSISEVHNRRTSGLKGPRQVGLPRFRAIAVDPRALRFSFVRNPYDRLVAGWAYWFRDQPLVAGHPPVDVYLAYRRHVAASLPAGAGRTLGFADFVTFATATATARIDAHWQLQADLLDVPGVTLNLVGKLESFDRDFARVLSHVRAPEKLRHQAILPVNESNRAACSTYYTQELADRVYRAYERDFDCLGYPRGLAR
jgi:Sulfotransferase family